ncbi:MAG: 3-phosphoshikimate 1-carboxyvinyltransferase [Parachlamydiales bacterium]
MNTCSIRGGAQLRGRLTIPPSKSHSMRALLFAALAMGESKVNNLLASPDVEAMVTVIRQMGAGVKREGSSIAIRGIGGRVPPLGLVDAANSGQILRFVGAVAALAKGPTLITGDESIRTLRPITPLIQGIKQLGGFAAQNVGGGLLVQGRIKPGEVVIDGADSQPVSALLIATSLLEGGSTIRVENPGETPWVGLTLSWLKRVGRPVSHADYQTFLVQGGQFAPFTFTVPGDYSSALYPAAAAFVTGSPIELDGLDPGDVQGDKRALDLLPTLRKGGCEIDVGPFIDALPLLAVLGCYAPGRTVLYGGAIARKKESDRISAIATELTKMGGQVTELPDGLIIEESPLRGARVSTYHDHRIALSLAIAALGARGETVIENPAVVAKSYPTFWEDMRGIGCQIG